MVRAMPKSKLRSTRNIYIVNMLRDFNEMHYKLGGPITQSHTHRQTHDQTFPMEKGRMKKIGDFA